MKRLALFVVLPLALAAVAPANAGLIIPPSASDVILTNTAAGRIDDTSYGPINLGFAFPFFGTTQTQIQAVSNGHIVFGPSPDNSFENYGFPAPGIGRVAPFFDDLFLPQGSSGSLRYSSATSGQLTVIWDGFSHYQSSSDQVTAEAILLGEGNQFGAVPGTIIFSYGTVTGFGMSPTVGLNEGGDLGTRSATLASILGTSATGTLLSSQASSLSNRTFTFSPNGSGSYDVTEGTPAAVPEPSTALLTGLSIALAVGLQAWRRRNGAADSCPVV